jgi:peptide/nickel transport system substrate-binding protein
VPELSLAASWEIVDPRTTNITLREGVMFHNGEVMTAYDVQFSLMESAQAGGVEILSGMIEEVVVHDDLNLTIITEFDFVPIISHLAHTSLSIVPMAYFLEVGEEGFEEHPIGSGPFMFVEHILGDRIEFARNENFWGNVPVIETLTFILVPDASVRLMEVSAGNADIATAVNPIDLAGAEADPNVTLMRRQNLSTVYIGFNVERPHINNPLVRQAINYALDTHAIVESVFMGLGQVQDGPMPNLVWGYSPQDPFPTDLDRARELLIEAGYNPNPGEPGGFSTSIWWNIPNAQREQISEMVQFSLAQLNIEVEIVGMEWAQYLADTGEGLHDMFILGWVSITGDPDYSLFPLFHSSNFGDAGNRTFWYEPRLDELLDLGRSTVDPAVRLGIYEEAQALIRENAPWVFLHNGEWAFAVSNNLNGFVLNPAGHHSFAPVWFD